MPRVLLTSAGPQHGIDKLTETHVAVPVLVERTEGEHRGRTHTQREREQRENREGHRERSVHCVDMIDMIDD